MAKDSFFQKQKVNYANSSLRKKFSMKAINWYQSEMKGLMAPARNKLIKDSALENRTTFRTGRLYHYIYDPKHKKTLPYYDKFPLMLFLEPVDSKSVFGLNLHYLPILYRAKFFSALLEFKNNKAYDKYTKLQMSYDLLKGSSKHAAFKPTFKRYLFSNIRSNIMEIPAEYWEIATFLPTENFAKSNRKTVWKDSLKMI